MKASLIMALVRSQHVFDPASSGASSSFSMSATSGGGAEAACRISIIFCSLPIAIIVVLLGGLPVHALHQVHRVLRESLQVVLRCLGHVLLRQDLVDQRLRLLVARLQLLVDLVHVVQSLLAQVLELLLLVAGGLVDLLASGSGRRHSPCRCAPARRTP